MSSPASSALPGRVGAVLFDMDDTLVRSEHAWFAATAALWREAGGDAADKGILGGTVEQLVSAFVTDFPTHDPGSVDRRLRTLLAERIADGVYPMPGAAELVARLSVLRVPITIASNSPSSIVRKVVAALGWTGAFTATLGTEDVEHAKPAPDLYLSAADRCGVQARDCVVFEDSPMGCASAVASGAFVVTVGAAAAGSGNLAVDSLLDERIATWHPEVLA